VGNRLKEERKRLGLTQEAMAAACGVAKRTQILFEQDAHLPGGAYFVEADKLGLDVTYLLVGRRERVGDDEAEMLETWRKASPKSRVAALVALCGKGAAAEPSPRTSFPNATIGQQISGDVDLRAQRIVVKPAKAPKKPTV